MERSASGTRKARCCTSRRVSVFVADGRLSLPLTSAAPTTARDAFNIASYALLTNMVATAMRLGLGDSGGPEAIAICT